MMATKSIASADRAFIAMLVVCCVLAPLACGARDRLRTVDAEACLKACRGRVESLTHEGCVCWKDETP